jgi:hypothetical protein
MRGLVDEMESRKQDATTTRLGKSWDSRQSINNIADMEQFSPKRFLEKSPRSFLSTSDGHHREAGREKMKNESWGHNRTSRDEESSPDRGSPTPNTDKSTFGWEILSSAPEDAKSLHSLRRAVR